MQTIVFKVTLTWSLTLYGYSTSNKIKNLMKQYKFNKSLGVYTLYP